MCGIICRWNTDGTPIDVRLQHESLVALRHRGPDDEGHALIRARDGEWSLLADDQTSPMVTLPHILDPESGAVSNPDLALGQTRLAIIDLSPRGHQPMLSGDGRYFITYNGEIFNFLEVRGDLAARGHEFRSDSDTEVVLKAYMEWGRDAFRRLNGMWAAVIWDQYEQRLVACRDRFGVKPLVYAHDGAHFACASEAKALLADSSISRRMDVAGIHHFFSLGHVPAPLTAFREIRRLEAGHMLVVEREGVRTEEYYSLRARTRERAQNRPIGSAAELDGLLRDAVQKRLIADVPVGAFLSGGVDSSVVAGVARTVRPTQELRTFCIAFSGSPQDESPWARSVAQAIGTHHSEFRMQAEFDALLTSLAAHCDEPFSSPSVLGVRVLAQHARQEVKAVLTGDGGDEVFAGYVNRHMGVDKRWDEFHRRPLGWLRSSTAVNGSPPIRWLRESLPQRLARRRRWERMPEGELRDRQYVSPLVAAGDAEKRSLYTPEWNELVGAESTEDWLLSQMPPRGDTDRLTRWQLFDIATRLEGEMLRKVDIGTMSHSLEARTPLLDYRLVEFGLNLPEREKATTSSGKLLLKSVGQHYAPLDALNREKQGFTVPLAEWLGDGCSGVVPDVLVSAELAGTGIFNRGSLADLVAWQLAHPAGGLAEFMLNMAAFELWRRNWGAHL